jgi:hypothetical protein
MDLFCGETGYTDNNYEISIRKYNQTRVMLTTTR